MCSSSGHGFRPWSYRGYLKSVDKQSRVEDGIKKQDTQCTCSVILRRVRVTIVAVEKQ